MQCINSDSKKSKAASKELNLNSARVYDSYEEMITKEKELPEDIRMDFVSIVIPNHVILCPQNLLWKMAFMWCLITNDL